MRGFFHEAYTAAPPLVTRLRGASRQHLEFRTDAAPVPGVTAYSKKAALVAEVWSAGGS
jgi:hypothetical protein